MTETIITTVGTSFAAIVGILISNKLSNYRIQQLEKKVDKHNTLIERMYKVESVQEEQTNEIKELKHSVESLRERRN